MWFISYSVCKLYIESSFAVVCEPVNVLQVFSFQYELIMNELCFAWVHRKNEMLYQVRVLAALVVGHLKKVIGWNRECNFEFECGDRDHHFQKIRFCFWGRKRWSNLLSKCFRQMAVKLKLVVMNVPIV